MGDSGVGREAACGVAWVCLGEIDKWPSSTLQPCCGRYVLPAVIRHSPILVSTRKLKMKRLTGALWHPPSSTLPVQLKPVAGHGWGGIRLQLGSSSFSWNHFSMARALHTLYWARSKTIDNATDSGLTDRERGSRKLSMFGFFASVLFFQSFTLPLSYPHATAGT